MEREGNPGGSEVARLRKRIELECEALQLAMYGPAIVSTHESINRRYKALDSYCDLLAVYIGQEEAARIGVETYTRVVQ